MTFLEAFRVCVTKYATFSGRARRSEYWLFSLAYSGAVIVAALFGKAIHVEAVGAVVLLGLLMPVLAVSVRRLHDIGRSGAWYLINFAPFGGLVLTILFCQDSDFGENAYGSSPKAAA